MSVVVPSIELGDVSATSVTTPFGQRIKLACEFIAPWAGPGDPPCIGSENLDSREVTRLRDFLTEWLQDTGAER